MGRKGKARIFGGRNGKREKKKVGVGSNLIRSVHVEKNARLLHGKQLAIASLYNYHRQP